MTSNIWNVSNFPIISSALKPIVLDVKTMTEGIEVVLPSEIYITEGDNLQLFYRGCIRAFNPYVFDVVPACSVGKSFPRYYEFKPTSEHVGNNYTLTLYVSLMTSL